MIQQNKKMLCRSIECKLGLGGIHGCNPGIYEEDDEYTILTFDVASYYPSFVISSKIYPAPIGRNFVKVYSGIKEQRFQYPKTHPLNKAYKDCLNSLIGYTKSVHSMFFDYKFFYSVTVNGQLILINLIEEIQDKYEEVYPIMVNTDGGELYVRKKDLQGILDTITEFGKRFGLEFEYSTYYKLVVKNVNNYIGISRTPLNEPAEDIDLSNLYNEPPKEFIKDGYKYKVKVKGETFVISIDINELHKNYSHLIIPKAIYNHYVFGIDVMNTIRNNTNFYDKIAYIRKNNTNKLYIVNPIKKTTYEINRKVVRYFLISVNQHDKIVKEFLSKYNYDISKHIGYISRITKDGKHTLLHKDNKYLEVMIDDIYQNINDSIENIRSIFEKYINLSYFANECNKVIGEMERIRTQNINLFCFN
jgi:hypothetical protein